MAKSQMEKSQMQKVKLAKSQLDKSQKQKVENAKSQTDKKSKRKKSNRQKVNGIKVKRKKSKVQKVKKTDYLSVIGELIKKILLLEDRETGVGRHPLSSGELC